MFEIFEKSVNFWKKVAFYLDSFYMIAIVVLPVV